MRAKPEVRRIPRGEIAMTMERPINTRQVSAPPRVVAVSGVVFSVLYIASLALVRLAVPADPKAPAIWLTNPDYRNWVRIAIDMIPFTGIAFLWFMAVLRNRIGLLEDRFFATVFLGSGLLFVSMLFAAAAVSRGLLETFTDTARLSADNETYAVGRATAHALMNTFGMKMAAIFMFVTSTIGLRTAVLARWVSLVGFALGLILLLVITDFAWIAMVVPCWVLLVSTYILSADFRHGAQTASCDETSARDDGTAADPIAQQTSHRS
jgi:hypothetical protein